MKKKRNKKNKITKILDLLIILMFCILTILLIINIIKLSNIENLIRIIIIIVLSLLIIVGIILKKKFPKLIRTIMIILSLGYVFLNYTFHKVYSSLDNITVQINTKVLCLVTSSDSITDLKKITDDNIAILAKTNDSEFYDLAEKILSNKKLENKLVEYDDYIEIINALLNKEITYAFLPKNYEDIYNASKDEKESLNFKVLYTETKKIKTETTPTKSTDLGEPFSLLLMGTDVILDSYNADTLMVLTVNPKTLKVTMLSVPRDTYTTICTGGKHKINSSGWYGDSCVVKTLEKYLDIDINYYAKINFLGIVDLVDKLGGIDVEVPYAFCEQNSAREFGNKMIFVEEGLQKLNGEQALALSRNRHYWKDMCPEKYTSQGERSDIIRGQNQQLVIKALMNKIMKIRNLDTFYGILDTVSKNMTTNMPKDTILSFYNVGKDILKYSNKTTTDELINIERLSFKSHSATVFISGLDLSMMVNYKESVNYVSNQMKKNLGQAKKDTIKTFSFDINENYTKEEIKFNSLTSNLKTLPNFVGKTLNEAQNYCNNNGLKCEFNQNDLTEIIISQSIHANTDISTIKNKTITFETDEEKLETKPEIEIPEDKEEITDKPENSTDKEQPTDKPENNNKEENKEPTEEPKDEPQPEEQPPVIPKDKEDKEDLSEKET